MKPVIHMSLEELDAESEEIKTRMDTVLGGEELDDTVEHTGSPSDWMHDRLTEIREERRRRPVREEGSREA